MLLLVGSQSSMSLKTPPSDLRRNTTFHDPVPHYMEAGLNKLYSERSLSDALCTTNMFTVAYNLPKNLFIADGSRTLDDMDITPDWGAGNETKLNKNRWSRALVSGDTKYIWPYREAISTIQRNEHAYEGAAGKEVARPLEQIQYYGMQNKSCNAKAHLKLQEARTNFPSAVLE